MLQTGEIIKNMRIENALTQSELASKLNITLSTLQKYESGAIQNIKLDTLKKICEILNLSPYVLVFSENIENMTVAKRFHLTEEDAKYFIHLNDEGTQKVVAYAKDLYDTGKYFD